MSIYGRRSGVNPKLSDAVIAATQGGTVGEFAAGHRPPLSKAPGTGIVWFGDSYSAMGGSASYTVDTDRSALSPAVWVDMLMHTRLRPIANRGVGGVTTSGFLAQLPAVLADAPDIAALVTCGVGDVTSAVPHATTVANLTTIFDTLNQAGIVVVTATCPPATGANLSGDRLANLFDLNRWLMAEAEVRPGLIVVDAFAQLASQSLTTVDWLPGYIDPNVSAGNHASVLGAFEMAALYAAALDKIVPGDASRLIRHAVDPAELCPNPCMTGTGGTGTGVIPASVTASGGTGSGSKVARTDGLPGDWFRWNQTVGTVNIVQQFTSGFSAGQLLVGRVELNCSTTPSAHTYMVRLIQFDAGVSVVGATVDQSLTHSGYTAPTHGRIVVELNPMTVDPAAVFIQLQVIATATANVDVGLMSCRVVDP